VQSNNKKSAERVERNHLLTDLGNLVTMGAFSNGVTPEYMVRLVLEVREVDADRTTSPRPTHHQTLSVLHQRNRSFSGRRPALMITIATHRWSRALFFCVLSFFTCSSGRSDVVVDWNNRAAQVVANSALTPPRANCVMALVQTSVYEAVNAITGRFPGTEIAPAHGASIDAAVAAANHIVLSTLIPSKRRIVDSLYESAMRSVKDGNEKSAGRAAGEAAAKAVLALRAGDVSQAGESYRPFTAAGEYVPTVIPIATENPTRKPWFMENAAQFRPGPPPSLTSALWARDFNEIKSVGAKNSTARTAAQTEIARFWEETMPPIYCGIVCSVALLPDREVTRNARLYAIVAQATDDALIAIMDAKYFYHFWRPITAIRNGDLDSNSVTERDPSWTPFVPTPMHPEYPCAHCIVSGVVGTILKAELGNTPCPTLRSVSAAAGGVERTWTNLDDFMTEVGNARIYDGVHYRTSTEVGTAMGKKIGELAISTFGISSGKGSDR
jgi:hypothetical protein